MSKLELSKISSNSPASGVFFNYSTDKYGKSIDYRNVDNRLNTIGVDKSEQNTDRESLYWVEPKVMPRGQSNIVLQAMNDGFRSPHEDYFNFNRFYNVNLTDGIPSNRHYVFMCRPDLYLLQLYNPSSPSQRYGLSSESRVAGDPLFRKLWYENPLLIESLTAEFDVYNINNQIKDSMVAVNRSGYGNSLHVDPMTDKAGNHLTTHSLLPFLTGRVQSIQIPDFAIKTYQMTQPYTKYGLPMSLTAIESTTGGSFDITFREDAQYSVTKLFYAWVYYMDGVMRNKFSPKLKYMRFNALDYATSIYDIIVGDDGEEIVWFGKYTGCIPTNVPVSDLGFNKGGSPIDSVSITFNYFNYEAMNPEILLDLNYNSLGYNYMEKYGTKIFDESDCLLDHMSTYNPDLVGPASGYVGRPFVVSYHPLRETEKTKHKLWWARPSY